MCAEVWFAKQHRLLGKISLLQNTREEGRGLCVALCLQEKDVGSSTKASCKNLETYKGSNVTLCSSHKRTNFSHSPQKEGRNNLSETLRK